MSSERLYGTQTGERIKARDISAQINWIVPLLVIDWKRNLDYQGVILLPKHSSSVPFETLLGNVPSVGTSM